MGQTTRTLEAAEKAKAIRVADYDPELFAALGLQRGSSYLSGETVTGGDFACERCGRSLRVAAAKVTNLPVCPSCQNESWKIARGLLRAARR